MSAPESSTPVETPTKTSLSTLPEKKLEVRVLKRTYVKVTKDEEGTQPVFEGYAAPDSSPDRCRGKAFLGARLGKRSRRSAKGRPACPEQLRRYCDQLIERF